MQGLARSPTPETPKNGCFRGLGLLGAVGALGFGDLLQKGPGLGLRGLGVRA